MFVYIRSAAFVIVVAQKLVLQQSKNITAKCTEILSPPPSIKFSLERTGFNMDAEITQQQIIFLALYLKFNLSKIKQVKHSYTVNFWLVVPEIIESTNAYIFFKSFHYLRKTLALGRMFSLNMSIPLNLEENFSCFTKFTNQITQRGS